MLRQNEDLSADIKALPACGRLFKVLKLVCVGVLAAVIAGLAYGAAGCFVLLNRQPRFILPNGDITWSQGFMVQGLIYCGFLAAFVVAEVLAVYFMYLRKKSKPARSAVMAGNIKKSR